jgi:branched-chain amino acid transport system permease protein
MPDLIQNTLDGVAAGASYALLAIGFTLIFGVMRRLNIAFGASIMVGIFLGAWVHAQWAAGLWMVALATGAGALIASVYVERLSFAAIRGDAALASMASSFALWMQIEQGVALVFPQRTTAYPQLPAPPDVVVGGLMLRGDDAVTLAVASGVLGLLWLLIHRTHFGLEMRALADSPEAARVARVNTARVAFLTFLLAGAIGAVAGLLIAGSDGQISPKFGLWATMKGLVAMMIGGLGSLRGAFLGGLALGIIEAQAQWYLGAQSREVVVYGLLFVCLILLPGGLARVRDTGTARKL